jgi:hypothetical protein
MTFQPTLYPLLLIDTFELFALTQLSSDHQSADMAANRDCRYRGQVTYAPELHTLTGHRAATPNRLYKQLFIIDTIQ